MLYYYKKVEIEILHIVVKYLCQSHGLPFNTYCCKTLLIIFVDKFVSSKSSWACNPEVWQKNSGAKDHLKGAISPPLKLKYV